MAETGNTMWNGNYGETEAARRRDYDRQSFEKTIKQRDEPSTVGPLRPTGKARTDSSGKVHGL